MKKTLPIFTLVRKSNISDKDLRIALEKAGKKNIKTFSGEVAKGFNAINPSLRSAIFASTLSEEALTAPEDVTKTSSSALEKIAVEMSRSTSVKNIGILDLGAWLGALPKLLEAFNRAQPAFTFFEVQSAVPAGIISQPERVVAWVEMQGIRMSRSAKMEISRNIIADEFFRFAERMRVDLGLDYLIGISPAMIAGSDQGEVFWNHFSIGAGRMILLSTADMREFASRAERPYEIAIGNLLVSQLIQMLSPKIGCHEDRGCLFDCNANKRGVIDNIKKPMIEKACLEKIPASIRQSAQSLITALSKYR